MERLGERGVDMIVYEPTLHADEIVGARVVNDLDEFKRLSDVIICNRYDAELNDVQDKVYTRDLWKTDE